MTKRAKATKIKRQRVERLLLHPKWKRRSTNWIARKAGVSWMFVDRIRATMRTHDLKRDGRDGRSYPSTAQRL